MRSLASIALSSVLFISILSGLTPHTADAQSPSAIASITLYHDSNGDGVFGSARDHVIDSAEVGPSGVFSLNSNGCMNCGVVVDGWGWDDPEIDSVGGTILGDGAFPSAGTATLWLDADSNGIFGTAGDTQIASGSLDSLGAYAMENVSLQNTAVVIDGWGWDDPEIDVIGGTINGWGWDDPEIDEVVVPIRKVGASSAEIDWGFGDDEIDWGFGDDEIDASSSN